MKLKSIAACLLALFIAIPAGNIEAQTRKKTTGTRKTATTGAKRTTGATAKPLTLDKVDNHLYYGAFMMDDLKKVGKDVGFYTYLILEPDDMTWYLLESKFGGTYSVASNTFTVKSGGLTMKLTSPDGGKTLKGIFENDKGTKVPMVYYQVKNGKIDSEVCKNSFAKGTFKALMEVVSPRGEETCFPVVFKATPNADGTGGTYKITVDNALGLGLIKGTYTISDKGVLFTSNLENCGTSEDEYSEARQEICFKLGTKYVAGSGKCSVYLRLFNQ